MFSRKKLSGFFWSAFLLLALAIPLSPFVSTRILVVLFVLALIFGEKKFNFFEFIKVSWDIMIYLAIIGIGLFYSTDTVTGLKTLETSFGLFAMPFICFKIVDINRQRLNQIFIFFSIGIFLAGLVCLITASWTYLKTNPNPELFFFYDFTNIIGSHPTYFAYYLIFAITFGLYALNYENMKLPLGVFVFFILFYFCVLLLTGGQTAFVSLLFVFSFFILKYLLGQKIQTQKITFGLVIAMLVCIFLVSVEEGSQREEMNDSWDRFILWRSAIQANSDYLTGVGTGDYKIVLNEFFREHNQEMFARESFNSHNQFIQIFFSNGFFGLAALTLMLLRPLYLAFKHNDQMGILILFPFLIYGMTEVFLGRYQGVVFYALLHQIFISFYLSSKQSFNNPTDLV
jgi:O-antigen ligase